MLLGLMHRPAQRYYSGPGASGTVDAFAGPGNGPGGIVTGVGITAGLGFGGAASVG